MIGQLSNKILQGTAVLFLMAIITALSPFWALAATNWSGSGHFQTEAVGFTPSPYTAQPNFLQNSATTDAADSAIVESTVADVWVNFTTDTTGKTIYLVYTTDGSAPDKANGTVVTATFANYTAPNSIWTASIPGQAPDTIVKYVFYISNGALASGWGRISGTPADHAVSQYQTSWSENDGAYFEYTVSPTLAVTLSWFRAAQTADGVHFAWQTATESGVAGFRLLSESAAGREQIDADMTPSRMIDSLTPQTYTLLAEATGERFYLQQVGINGVVEEFGPFGLDEEFGSYMSASPFAWPNNQFMPLFMR
ncbi:MAG: hypothetical protein H6642_08095 [Caldilineaceae bacterium]|nr:hypothetical protein [Caldilineaceae bacterium]